MKRQPIVEVIVDRRVLDSFRRRALGQYPLEYASELWGRACKGQAHIYQIQPVKAKARHRSVDFTFEDECGTRESGMILLGSIHSHPNNVCEPSDADRESALDEGEIVFGICGIRRAAQRRFVSWGFWDNAGEKLQLTVSV